jgi:two-component system phosphate regulon sensor histidine kinase PhoR
LLLEFARVPELEGLLAAARSVGRTVEAHVRLAAPRERSINVTVTPLASAYAGSALVVMHDASEAERLNRMRQDFVANVSHELRTPLTSIHGYAETLLQGGLEDGDNRERFVQVIHGQAARLGALVDDLLSLAELERPGAQPRLAAIDLRALVERQLAAFRPRAERAGVALELAPGAPLPLRADPVLLEQVIANLVDNALKYTERGAVRLTLGASDDRAWCEVRDTGSGIPEEDLDRIFERFYRVDKARSREKGGTGLGLSIVKHIVTLHGGEVAVESRLGAGSTFRFEIPRDPEAG